MTQLVLNPQEFGLDEIKANELKGNLPQIILERESIQPQYDEVMRMDIESPETVKRAKEVRKLIKDNRTKGIEVWHKTTKEYFLKGGQFVDAIKRKEIAINEKWESDLEAIEKYAENKEKERLAKLQKDREALLIPFEVANVEQLKLSEMPDAVFENFYNGCRLSYEQKKEAESKAEEERIAKEKAEAEERERVRIENERLKKEAEEREKQIAKERAKAEAERKALEEKQRKEREASEAKLKAEREAKAKLEAELKVKAEAEAKAKRDAELKAEQERKEKESAEKKAKAAPDKEKLLLLAQTIDAMLLPELKTDEANKVLSNTKDLLVKVSNYIREQSNKL